ncbi:hypothetical protein LOY94_006889 [Ophidiomyces ophidiicola]|uniref:Uncharacterized protein n=1 Tax=Ophidiomyces ophidiicola TaxID=1387563 RepID=A0ACB8UML9_9EURO|nr:hypothetical protein LOZ64_006848 [Ophidiomyces ophidiicola]KAI1927859.1 hypothetical protein LOZ60_002689 [Ophidiomyces ophidiicola]KAI1998402.1 hypothetical protein LOZ50_006856 [Ophidiomyces ophidiicola]KAI1999731.1 hypothetical protein LOZ49_006821 [Ophidiomyces ophidiicola]KAI2005425.1 hypothetical protein LOZ46_006864 [Ophidiomyces ophidiicola]
MISGKSRRSVDSSWDQTPESSPQTSSDSDSDRDDCGSSIMDAGPPSRPLSIAVPGSQPPRPTLDDVLADRSAPPYTLSAFTAYLSQNHCLETLEFTKDAERYRAYYLRPERADSSDAQHLQRLRVYWHRIINAYIVPGAPREINLPSTVRDGLLSHSSAAKPPPHPDVLQPAVRRIRDLMDESIFLPFLNRYSASQPPTARTSVHYSAPNFALESSSSSSTSGGGGRGGARVARHTSVRRHVSPETAFAVPRSSGCPPPPHPTSHAAAAAAAYRTIAPGYASGDSGSLTDDSSSLPSSPGAGEPMTPPTTPPGSEVNSPRARTDKGWKKMGMRLGWKK